MPSSTISRDSEKLFFQVKPSIAVMVVNFSPQWLLGEMLNSSGSMLACSKASPRFSRNILIGSWLLPKMLS